MLAILHNYGISILPTRHARGKRRESVRLLRHISGQHDASKAADCRMRTLDFVVTALLSYLFHGF